jgi:ketosteroid isomerase-like protein
MRNSRLYFTLTACAFLITLGTGCGQTDQEQVREVTEDYIDAIAKGDYEAACELFTPAYLSELDGTAGCARSQADQFGGPSGSTATLEIAAVRTKGDRANVTINVSRGGSPPSPLALLMSNEADDWRISGQQ